MTEAPVAVWDVSGNTRVLLDESNCVVIEQDRLNREPDRYTVTDVRRLIVALASAARLRRDQREVS